MKGVKEKYCSHDVLMSLKCHQLESLRRIKPHPTNCNLHLKSPCTVNINPSEIAKKKISLETLLFHISWLLCILFIYMMKFHTAIFLFSSTLLHFTFFFFLSLLLCNSLPVEKKKRRERRKNEKSVST